MLTATPSAYARLPTYSEVVDGLATGLGIIFNKENKLGNHALFRRRIDAYSGSPQRAGLEKQLLDLLAGENEVLQRLVRLRLLDAETALTNARAIPLVTEATEAEGLRRFIEIWAAPWIAQVLADARHYPESVLGIIWQLLKTHDATPASNTKSFLSTWKSAIKQAIPTGANANEFRTTIDKLDQRSQRTRVTIGKYINKLKDEMRTGSSTDEELDAAAKPVERLYHAGMATMRLCAMATEIIPEKNLLALVTDNLREDLNPICFSSEKAQEIRMLRYWECFDPHFKLANEFNRLCQPARNQNDQTFDQLRTDSHSVGPADLLIPAIDLLEGLWHLHHGRNDLAEQYLQKVIENANRRQLGAIASHAASLLIALRLMKPGASLLFEAMNPLLRVRIDNIEQSTEMISEFIPTPFSDSSPRTVHSFYDSHLIQCVAYFNNLILTSICNPLLRFDAGLKKLIARSQQAGAELTERERNRPAIVGTSIKPYQMLRDWRHYRVEPFGHRLVDLPGINAYSKLPEPDQLRLLRFIDPVQFQLDLKTHGLDSWKHPDDAA